VSITSLGDALFTKTQQRVLGLLYGKPDARFYGNEILRLLGMGRGTVRRELERLASAGIVVVSREGNLLYYQVNAQSPIYADLLNIVIKTFGVADSIRAALQPLDEHIQLAFVYGSLAKATDNKTSDIDVMLVSDVLPYGDVLEALLPLGDSLKRPVNPTIYTWVELESKIKAGNGFLSRVMEQPKLWVKGRDDDIKNLR
jgi:predicted nucleotidyltransferase